MWAVRWACVIVVIRGSMERRSARLDLAKVFCSAGCLIWSGFGRLFSPTVVAKTKPESIAQELPQETILRKRKRKRRAPQVELAGELLAIVFPRDGWHGMTTATIRHKCDIDPRVKAKLRKDERMLPSPESFDRFMKRANTRRR